MRIPSEDLEKHFRVLCDLKELRETITNLGERVKSVSPDQTSTLMPALAVVRERYWIQNREAVSFAQHWGQENIDVAWAHYWQPEEEDAEEGDFARAAEECEAAMAKLTEHRARVAEPHEDEAEVPLEASSVPVVAEAPVEQPTPSVDPVASRTEERDSPAAPKVAVPEVVAPELAMALEVEGEAQGDGVTSLAKEPTPPIPAPAATAEPERSPDDSLFNEVDRPDPIAEARKAEVVESASEDSEPVRPSPRKKKGKAKAKAAQPAVEVITIDSDSDDDEEEPPLLPSLPPPVPIHPPNPHRHRSSTGSPDLVVVVRPSSHLTQKRKRSSAAPLPLPTSKADSIHSDADDEAAVSSASANEAAIDSDAQLSPPLLPTYASPGFVPTLRLDPRAFTFRRFAPPSRPSIPLLDAPTRFATLKRKRSASSSTAPSSLTASRAKELLEMGDEDEDEDEDRGGETEVVPDSEGEEALPLPSSSQPPSKRRKVFEAWKARFEASGGVSGLGESGKKRKRSD
ncbi:hypothetical protein RQP46_001401 [Phenoliferia psychrophenolica]